MYAIVDKTTMEFLYGIDRSDIPVKFMISYDEMLTFSEAWYAEHYLLVKKCPLDRFEIMEVKVKMSPLSDKDREEVLKYKKKWDED